MSEGIGRTPSDNDICGKSTISESRDSCSGTGFILEKQLLLLHSKALLVKPWTSSRLNSHVADRCGEASQGRRSAVSVVESDVGMLRRQTKLFKQVNCFLSGKRQRFFFDN